MPNLSKKLGIPETNDILVVNAPMAYEVMVDMPGLSVMDILLPNTNVFFAHVFAPNFKFLETWFIPIKEQLDYKGCIWVSWPKKSSGVETDLSSQIVREYGLNCGLVDVKVASVNDTWSALKFVWRVKDRK